MLFSGQEPGWMQQQVCSMRSSQVQSHHLEHLLPRRGLAMLASNLAEWVAVASWMSHDLVLCQQRFERKDLFLLVPVRQLWEVLLTPSTLLELWVALEQEVQLIREGLVQQAWDTSALDTVQNILPHHIGELHTWQEDSHPCIRLWSRTFLTWVCKALCRVVVPLAARATETTVRESVTLESAKILVR